MKLVQITHHLINILLICLDLNINSENFNHIKTTYDLEITLKIVCLQTPPYLKNDTPPQKDYVLAFLNRGTNRVTVVKNQGRNCS